MNDINRKAVPRQFAAIGFLTILLLIAAPFTTSRAQGIAPLCVPNPVAEDSVMEWNCRAVNYALSPTFGGALRQIRAMAVVQVAVHNAVNGITGEYETWSADPANAAPASASADAAAIGAAYQSLFAMLTPAQRLQLDAELATSLAARGIAGDDPGLAYGRNVGARIAAVRASDGSGPEAQCAYADITSPQWGDWVRIRNVLTGATPAAATPCWRFVPPFVLQSADQFPLEDPPALNSTRYLQDLFEVKTYGGQNADTWRSVEQSRVADFWDGSPVGITNQVLRQAAAAQQLPLSDKARAFALVYVTGTDASIACWHYKYTKLFWRPETAINVSDPLPGNVYWLPYLFPSHPHPEYPSGHSTNSGAMLAAAALVFGDEPGVTLTPTITRLGIAVTPQWESFSEGIDEVVSARVYSGLHYRFTDEASANLGKRIARFVYQHALRDCRRGGNCR